MSDGTTSETPRTAFHRTRTALVTGASTGIGEQFARDLAERGFALVLVARRGDALKDLADDLQERFGVRADALPADLGDPSGLNSVEERLRADGTGADAPVDLLVNNAGRGDGGTYSEQDPEVIDAILDLNVRAMLRLARAVLPVQIARRAAGETRRLGIVNVSSVAGELPASPGGSVYGAAKAFITQWSASLALENAPHGVQVTAVVPGYVRTDLTQGVQRMGLPELAFVPKETITRDALRAWAAGRSKVVPSVQYRAADGLLRVVPRGLFTAIAGRVTGQDRR